MTRMEIQALLKVANAAETGRYTLPAELTEALSTYRRTNEVNLPEVQRFQVDQAAGRIFAAVQAGEDPGMGGIVKTAAHAANEAAAVTQVQYALELARELAENGAVLVAADMAEHIITDHLAPAYRQMLDEVREVATALEGCATDGDSLLTAPTKVQKAYLRLPELVDRNKAIREARGRINVAANRKPQHDVRDLFALFSKPMALRPGWKPPAHVPMLDMPTDDRKFLLWLVSDKAAPGEPWLPTVAQQDAAYWEQFGEAQEMRKQAHHNGLAVGSRVGA